MISNFAWAAEIDTMKIFHFQLKPRKWKFKATTASNYDCSVIMMIGIFDRRPKRGFNGLKSNSKNANEWKFKPQTRDKNQSNE